MTDATNHARLLYRPADSLYNDEHSRRYQGCSTIAATKGGRLYIAWYSGGICEPHIDNFNLVMYSDDKGESWQLLLVIPGSREFGIHALDIQLWTAPDGRLFVYWVQNKARPAIKGDGPKNSGEEAVWPNQPKIINDGWIFDDFAHSEWCAICDDPDADEPVFSIPRRFDQGFLRCKPTVTKTGRWINFNYDQLTDRYGYSFSDDKGATWQRRYGGKKIDTYFDECMAYQLSDGSIRMLARCKLKSGELAESWSHDDGLTWTDAKLSGIDSPDTRFWIGWTPKGNLLMINNDDREKRRNLTAYLSLDEGKTWAYKKLIDPRMWVDYPDVDFIGGTAYLTYDRERTGAKEILLTSFTDDDIMNDDFSFDIRIVSKA